MLVDEAVIEHPAEIRAEVRDCAQAVGIGVEPGQGLLDQIFGIILGAGEAHGQAVETLEMRLYELLKAIGFVLGVGSAHVLLAGRFGRGRLD